MSGVIGKVLEFYFMTTWEPCQNLHVCTWNSHGQKTIAIQDNGL